MSEDLCYLEACEAIQLFRKGEVSPVDILRAQAERIESCGTEINAFTALHFERALEQARKAETAYLSGTARPLEGVNSVIKDETFLAGEITTNGSRLMRDHRADVTDPVPERLIGGGAVVSGRTTTPEFSVAAYTWSDLWGVTRNPWNQAVTPGGSSGGSAAAVAAGFCTIANGTDMGGSVRIPASMCGLVGLKASYGRVPEIPPYNIDPYVHHSVLTRSVRDTLLLYNLIAGPHPVDLMSQLPKEVVASEPLDLRGMRVGLSLDLGFYPVEDDVRENTLRFTEQLRHLGAEVDTVSLDWDERCIRTAQIHQGAQMGHMLRQKFDRPEYHDQLTSYARHYFSLSEQATPEEILWAHSYAQSMWESLERVFRDCDFLLCPTVCTTKVPADFDYSRDLISVNGQAVDPVKGWFMTYPFNTLSRCPVLSLPSGMASNGVPTGAQLVGRPYTDAAVLRAGLALEQAGGPFINKKHYPQLHTDQQLAEKIVQRVEA
ncbi:amidase [Microbulbifer flavimaris]|uniref:Amidase n=1 Tax=Microbulbifer flavimaris TaxID=1781068 RepID=A0ABX4I363_9GAMM|nr:MULTISPECIES: amidase [Microbulbifer]KUJ84527.1 amidase [Microbulbifer sp. ZGT114]PCO06613.1 amidase [Microbulbifer flavimaris]